MVNPWTAPLSPPHWIFSAPSVGVGVASGEGDTGAVMGAGVADGAAVAAGAGVADGAVGVGVEMLFTVGATGDGVGVGVGEGTARGVTAGLGVEMGT